MTESFSGGSAAADLLLPRPTRERFQPLRAGIVNVWHYDEQEFWFHDGRLILRGANETGKSKALEVLLPFLFDADIRPQRLDPFGGGAKTMHWNLAGFDRDRKVAIGYTWIEFGRLDASGSGLFLTLGAGMRATADSRDVRTWYFLTHRRVREGLRLLDGRMPVTREKLVQEIGESGEVFDVARLYREAVDRALFGLGAERYGALVHLLLQLRRPNLSEKLDPAALSDVLSESLPPLDESKMSQLAQAFDSLESEMRGLASLERAHRAVGSFREEYAVHAKQRARIRATAMRRAVTRLDGVTRAVRTATNARDDAARRIAELERDLSESKKERAGLDGKRRALEGSSAMRDARRLEELRQAARAARELADAVARQLDEARDELTAAEGELEEAEERSRRAGEARAGLESHAERRAEDAGMAIQHRAHAEEMRESPEKARAALDDAAARRLRAIEEVKRLEANVEEAERRLEECRRRADDASDRFERAEEEVTRANRTAREAEDAFEDAISAWIAGLDGVRLPPGAAERIVEDAIGRVGEGRSAAPLGHEVLFPFISDVGEELTELRIERNRTEAEEAELLRKRAGIESARDEGPAERVGRSPAEREGRPGAALWELCDFAPDLDRESRARVEAALEAAGVLDAWVTPDGRLLDAASLDVVLTPERGRGFERSLADVLVPDGGDRVPDDVVTAILESVALGDGPEPSGEAWVSTSGEWRLGPLRGRWAKGAAEHIGASAREATRRRRLAEIDARLSELAAALSTLDGDIRAREARAERLRAAAAAFPDGSPLLEARADVKTRGEVARRAREEVSEAQGAVMKASRERDMARAELREAAMRERLLDFLGRLETHAGAVRDYRQTLAELSSSCSRWIDARNEEERAERRRDESKRRAETHGSRSEDAMRAAEMQAAEARSYEETVGREVHEVVARQEEVLAELDALDRRQGTIHDDLREAEVARATAQERLEQAERERAEREEERKKAADGLERLAATEVLELAVPDLEVPEPPWNVTSALELARSIESRTSDVAVDEAALDRASSRVYREFNTLRTELGGDFDPSLAPEGDLLTVTVRHNARERGVSELVQTLAEEVDKRRELLEQEERNLIERHLVGEVGHHLQTRVAHARRIVDRMNHQLAEHPTNSGIILRLRWTGARDIAKETELALRLLRKDVRLLVDEEREGLVQFLRRRITEARQSEDVGSSAERMARALDYRAWHRFEIVMVEDGRERVMTAKTHGTGSGGSRSLLVHLPLFAAASAHYGSARPEAPRLVMLDEAFSTVDASQRGNCMGLLVDFDLDFLFTNFQEWGCYEELPGVATYHLHRDPGSPGVAAVRFVWDGASRVEDDPFLEAQLAGATNDS